VSGIPDSYVLLHDGEYDTVATDDSCDIHPAWNASVCTGDVGRLYVRAAGGGRGRGGFGGGFGGPRPPEEPVILVRNGKEHTITGNQSTVRAGTEIEVLTERTEMSLNVSEMDKDSWLMFELPGFASASGPELNSMGALRDASATSWYKDGDTLWVKLVVPADPELPIRPTVMQESITVSR
jgi:hypothetical protein